LQQRAVALVVGRVHLEDGAADDRAQRRHVVRRRERGCVAEDVVGEIEVEDRHLPVVGDEVVVRADHPELLGHRPLMHLALLAQLSQARVGIAHQPDAAEAILGREGFAAWIRAVTRGACCVHAPAPVLPLIC
jgi:hypothetical protein